MVVPLEAHETLSLSIEMVETRFLPPSSSPAFNNVEMARVAGLGAAAVLRADQPDSVIRVAALSGIRALHLEVEQGPRHDLRGHQAGRAFAQEGAEVHGEVRRRVASHALGACADLWAEKAQAPRLVKFQ